MRRASLLGVALGVGVLLYPAPGCAARKDMEILQADVDDVQRQVYELKRLLERQAEDLQRIVQGLSSGPDARAQLAEFNANVESLRRELRELGSRFDRTTDRLNAIERRLAATPPAQEPTDGPLAPAVPGPAGAPPPPASGEAQALYQQAYGDYLKDRYEIAVTEFRDFLTRFPRDPLAGEAQYWLAMSYFNQKQHDQAVREFDVLLERYPTAENAPAAAYRKGVCLIALGRLGQAVLVLNEVTERYPDSPAAAQARERLRELEADSR